MIAEKHAQEKILREEMTRIRTKIEVMIKMKMKVKLSIMHLIPCVLWPLMKIVSTHFISSTLLALMLPNLTLCMTLIT